MVSSSVSLYQSKPTEITKDSHLYRDGFVPPTPIRQLRDLTRLRTSLRQDPTAVANRVQKILEDANSKLAVVASDWLGASGRAMLGQLLAGEEDSAQLADLARGRLREKIPALQRVLEGGFTDHHRWLLRLQWEQLNDSRLEVERFNFFRLKSNESKR